eukprot:4774913-Pyramimonas_sp.AAC.1
MSGLGHEWWKEAMQAFCCGRNFVHPSTGVAALSDEHTDKTTHDIRCCESAPGHCMLFRVRILWKCLNPEINNETAKFKYNTREGLFMGYHLHSGGRWSGDYRLGCSYIRQEPRRRPVS